MLGAGISGVLCGVRKSALVKELLLRWGQRGIRSVGANAVEARFIIAVSSQVGDLSERTRLGEGQIVRERQ